eukprot:14792882-Alexandrium_andersonii.AAC.1
MVAGSNQGQSRPGTSDGACTAEPVISPGRRPRTPTAGGASGAGSGSGASSSGIRASGRGSVGAGAWPISKE